jgi:tRNA pseudouridine65 synthase
MNTMLLHASSISFDHPATGDKITIEAPLQTEFIRMMRLMGWM